jgi:xylose isomerase
MAGTYRFSFGPWNISSGADPFGPPVRDSFTFSEKLETYKKLGFEGVQFHDDDVVASADDPWAKQEAEAKAVRRLLDERGLTAEFVAPRLWEHPLGIDGSITANSPEARAYAAERSRRAIDIANIIGAQYIVLWPAREGTYMREAKDPVASVGYLVEWLNMMLAYDPAIRIMGEMKPNEPMDQAYLPTVGHWLGLAALTVDPARVGALIESAHSILAGLDPSDDMAYALYQKKLWSVHLNDQNGLKFDQDKAFGAVDLRRAFNQVWLLERNAYGAHGEFVGLDVKAVRTQVREASTKHLSNSRTVFLRLVELARSLDVGKVEAARAARDYEELDLLIMEHLLGA